MTEQSSASVISNRMQRKAQAVKPARGLVYIPPIPMSVSCGVPGPDGLIGKLVFAEDGTIAKAVLAVDLKDPKTKPMVTLKVMTEGGMAWSLSLVMRGSGNTLVIEKEIPVDSGSVVDVLISDVENIKSAGVGISFVPVLTKAQKESFVKAKMLEAE